LRRTALLLSVLAVALAALAAAVGADSGTVSVTPVARLPFPERGFLLGLPTDRPVSNSDVVVRENGEPVTNTSLVPADRSIARLGTILVIDASDSMKGQPLNDAFAAARLFTRQFTNGERVGVLTFNAKPSTLQVPTTDSTKADAALATVPRTRQGTHIYDAVAQALVLLRNAHVSAGSIVLLSDGADTGSATKETQLATRAQRMRVRIFSVGLHSDSFAPSPLQRLARDTHAVYAEATSSKQLGPIYAQIGRKLANEYLLRYRSTANPGARIVVTVNVRGVGGTTLLYNVPKIVAVQPFHRSIVQRFWSSGFSLFVIALLAAGLAALGATLLLRTPPSTVVARISEFADLSTGKDGDAEAKAPMSSRLFGSTERSLSRTAWWTRFREELEIAGIKYSAEQILGVAIIGTILAGLLLVSLAPILVIFAFFVPAIVFGACREATRRVRRRFEDQLPDNLQVLASALRAGHSFVGALSVVATDASEPSKREFTRVVADEQLGVPLEISLRDVSRRMGSSDLEQVALVAELQRQSGGNMAEVLDRVVDTIRGRFDLRRLVRTLTAQGRLARWILTLLPVVLALLIEVSNPDYMAPLFGTGFGQFLLVLATIMIVSGSLLIKKIVNIKV
jgi:tight adherence protein B